MLYVDLYLSSVDIFRIINVGGVKTAQNIAALAEAEEKRNRKLADERAELRERIDDQIEEKDTDIEMAECEDMEVQPVSLTVKEKQEVREMVTCLLRQRLGKLGHLVTRYLDGHGSMRSYMPVLHTAAESLRFDVSPAAAAAVATGFLKDLIAAGHLPDKMEFLAMDPNKLRRAGQTVMRRTCFRDLGATWALPDTFHTTTSCAP